VSPRLARALARDSLHPVWVFARRDVPLDSVARWVQARGGAVRRTSRWLRAVSAVLPPAVLDAARAHPGLQRIQPVARFRRNTDLETVIPEVVAPALRAPGDDSAYGASAMPFRRLNLFPLVAAGLRGAGLRIAVLDTGFETELSVFDSTTVAAQYDFIFNDSIVRNEAADVLTASNHGTSVWSLLAGHEAGTLIGIAPDAEYLLAKTEDVRSETPVEEDNFVAALEWADSLGADLVTASLGYLTFDGGTGYSFADLNGDVAVTTRATDSAVARGIVVLAANGNGGPAARTLITPADGDSVLGIGAEDSTGVAAGFSSRGPTADDRIKPDLSAPGVAIWVAVPSGGATAFGRVNGTSFATPILAGATALFLEAHPAYDPIAVRAALRLAADQAIAPDNARGWGRPDLHRATVFPAGVIMTESGDTLTAATPRFTWSAPDPPVFATPLTFRLRVTRDGVGSPLLLDTTTTDTTVTLAGALHGGTRIAWQLTATSRDSAVLSTGSAAPLAAPAWVRLDVLDNPAGVTIREFRPEFRWSSPDVAAPPGPFTYQLRVVRADGGVVDLEVDSLTGTTYVPSVDLERNTPYRWSVTARLGDESETTESRGTFVIVDDSGPPITTLFQNFPNPFPRPEVGQFTTCLWFDIAKEGVVSLEIRDLRGLLVRRLIPSAEIGPLLPTGRYGRPEPGTAGCDPRFEWDGTTDRGETVSPGVYLARLGTPEGVFFKRIVFLGTTP
jgi:Subtilase family